MGDGGRKLAIYTFLVMTLLILTYRETVVRLDSKRSNSRERDGGGEATDGIKRLDIYGAYRRELC